MVNLCHPWLPMRLCMPSVTCWGVLVWNLSRMHFPTRQQLPICWILIKVTGRDFTTRTHRTSNAAQCPGHALLGSDFFWHSKGWGIWAISFRHFGGILMDFAHIDNLMSTSILLQTEISWKSGPWKFQFKYESAIFGELAELTATASVKVFRKCKKDFRNLRTESLFSLPFEDCITIFLKSWPL